MPSRYPHLRLARNAPFVKRTESVDTVDTPVERLDEEKIELLRRWGVGLQSDERDELRAAGRAILLLIEEIERLHVERWNLQPDPDAEPEEVEIHTSLLERLHLGRKRTEEAPG
jgi:hypothetical protein